MKKILAIALVLVTVLSLAACGTKDGPETTAPEETTAAPAVQLEGTLEEIANKVIENTSTIEMMLALPQAVDFSNIDAAEYNLGINPESAAKPTDKIDSAVYVDPSISSIPFSVVVIDVKDGVDVEAFKNEYLESLNLRKWYCVSAEKAVVANCGNTVIMVMSTVAIADDVYNAFNIVASGNASPALTKDGEINEIPPVDGEAAMDEPAAMPGEGEEIILG